MKVVIVQIGPFQNNIYVGFIMIDHESVLKAGKGAASLNDFVYCISSYGRVFFCKTCSPTDMELLHLSSSLTSHCDQEEVPLKESGSVSEPTKASD